MAEKARKNSVFTPTQEVFIVEKFVALKSGIKVKRAFRKEYGNSKWLQQTSPKRFKEVYQRFQEKGVSPKKNENPRQQKGVERHNDEKMELITNFFVENPFASLFDGSKELKIPKSTIGWYLKRAKMKPYKT